MDEQPQQPGDGTASEPKKRGRPWVKGQSGNPKGRASVKIDLTRKFRESMAVRIPQEMRAKLVKQYGDEIPKRCTYLDMWVMRMRNDACNGDHIIGKYIWERLEGKVQEKVSHSFENPLDVAVAQKEAEDPDAPDKLTEAIRQIIEADILPEKVTQALVRSLAPESEDDKVLSEDSAPN